jgi:tetratricopeptide (TPR) repeat protein
MKETVETLLNKDDEGLRFYASTAELRLLEELFTSLWGTIRNGRLAGGQPRSESSGERVTLARLALTLAEHSEDDRLKAEAWNMMAYTLNANENYRECLPFYERCLEAFEKLGEHGRAARTRLGFMTARATVGKYDEAIRIGLAADEWFRENEDLAGHARYCVNLATVYNRSDRHKEAVPYLEEAAGIFSRLDDQQALAQCYITLGNSLSIVGRFADSEEAYGLSERISERLGLDRLLIHARYNRAYVYLLRGQYSQARASYAELRKVFAQEQSLKHYALCDLDEAEIYLQLNLPQEASRAAERAIDSFGRQNMRYEQAKATAFFAIALTQNRQFGDALQAFKNAKALFSEEGNAYWIALLDLYKAEVLFSLGRYWESDSAAKSAERQFDKLGKTTNRAISLVLLARVAMQLGRLDEAQFFANAILDLMREHQMPLLGFPCYALCAEIAEKTGDGEKAKELYEQAARESEGHHTHVDHDELRIAFFKRKREVYESLVSYSFLAEPPGIIEAFRWCERAKGTELVDLLVHHFPSVRGRADQALVQRVTRIREELNGSYLRSRPEVSDIAVIPDAAGIDMKEDELLRTLRELSETDPDYVSLQSVEVADITAVQACLPGGTQLVQFFAVAEEVIAFVIDKESIQVVRHIIPMSRANFLISRLRMQLDRFEKHVPGNNGTLRAADCRGTLQSLYSELFTALQPLLTGSRLVIVADGPLHLLPFHALFDGEAYLGDRYEIAYAPSSSVFRQNMLRPAQDNCIQHETEIVYRPNRPLFSCFKAGDDWITALDLFSKISECDIAILLGKVSGIEPARSGEDFQALVRAFLYSGARSVLLGLWTTPPESSAPFMRYFNEERQAGQTKAGAVRKAVQRLRPDFPHPFHWAPFVLFGQYS